MATSSSASTTSPSGPASAGPAPGAPKDRETLKAYFQRGSLPTEQSFAALIDSAVNRLDDGFAIAPGYGLQLVADNEKRLTTFYKGLNTLESKSPAWFLEVATAPDDGSAPAAAGTLGAVGLNFAEAQPQPDDAADNPTAVVPGTSRLHLHAGGNVGIGTTTPTARLDVQGFVASQGRWGGYTDARHPNDNIPADGQWYPILSGLDGLHAFEIVAAAYGPEKQGRYALTHAIVLSAFGKSRSRIFRKNAWFWGWFQKIQFRWTGELHNYGLEMRTASAFGDDSYIVYHITHLFDNRRPKPVSAVDVVG